MQHQPTERPAASARSNRSSSSADRRFASARARPDRQIDAVHRQRLGEPLDQAHRLDRERHVISP